MQNLHSARKGWGPPCGGNPTGTNRAIKTTPKMRTPGPADEFTEKCEGHKVKPRSQFYTDHEIYRLVPMEQNLHLTGTVTDFAFGVGITAFIQIGYCWRPGRPQCVRRKPVDLRCLERSESESTAKIRGPVWVHRGPPPGSRPVIAGVSPGSDQPFGGRSQNRSKSASTVGPSSIHVPP